MSERVKFIVLLVLLIASVGLLWYVTQSTSANFTPFQR